VQSTLCRLRHRPVSAERVASARGPATPTHPPTCCSEKLGDPVSSASDLGVSLLCMLMRSLKRPPLRGVMGAELVPPNSCSPPVRLPSRLLGMGCPWPRLPGSAEKEEARWWWDTPLLMGLPVKKGSSASRACALGALPGCQFSDASI